MRSPGNVFEILCKFLVLVIVIIMILSSALMQTKIIIIIIIINFIKSSSEWVGKKLKIEK